MLDDRLGALDHWLDATKFGLSPQTALWRGATSSPPPSSGNKMDGLRRRMLLIAGPPPARATSPTTTPAPSSVRRCSRWRAGWRRSLRGQTHHHRDGLAGPRVGNASCPVSKTPAHFHQCRVFVGGSWTLWYPVDFDLGCLGLSPGFYGGADRAISSLLNNTFPWKPRIDRPIDTLRVFQIVETPKRASNGEDT